MVRQFCRNRLRRNRLWKIQIPFKTSNLKMEDKDSILKLNLNMIPYLIIEASCKGAHEPIKSAEAHNQIGSEDFINTKSN